MRRGGTRQGEGEGEGEGYDDCGSLRLAMLTMALKYVLQAGGDGEHEEEEEQDTGGGEVSLG